jgi:hypothetical protein
MNEFISNKEKGLVILFWMQLYAFRLVKTSSTLKFTWPVHRKNLHLRFNWDLNLIEVGATQFWSSRWDIHGSETNEYVIVCL